MAIQGFSSNSDLCSAAKNPARAEQTIFFEGTPMLGTKLYTDASKTLPKASGHYPLLFANRTYKLFLDGNGTITSISECQGVVTGVDGLLYMPSQELGMREYPPESEEYWKQKVKASVTEVDGRLKLSDPSEAEFMNGPGDTFQSFLGQEKDAMDGVYLDNLDVDDMRGFSFNLVNVKKNSADRYQTFQWGEQFIHLPTKSEQNRRRWTEGNIDYAFMPETYQFTDEHLMRFDIDFPDFTLPDGKINVMQVSSVRNLLTHDYIKKGVSYTKENPDKTKRFDFVSDEFLVAIGCPPAYDNRPNRQQIFEDWCRSVTAEQILNSFKQRVVQPYQDTGYILMNWEYVGNRFDIVLDDVNQKTKIQPCLDHYHSLPQRAPMGLWIRAPFKLSQVLIETGQLSPAELLADFTFSGSKSDFENRAGNTFSRYGLDMTKVDILQCGDYVHHQHNYSCLHILAAEMIVNKRFYPDKTCISTFWTQVEPVHDGNQLGRSFFRKANGQLCYRWTKTQIHPSLGQSYAVVSLTLGDGLDTWNDTVGYHEDPEYHGPGGIPGYGCFLRDNTALPARMLPGSPLPGWYAMQPMKAVDWIMAGVWAVSLLKDIYNDKMPINWAEHSTDGGATYLTGDDKLPVKTLFAGGTICYYHLNAAGTQAALVVINPFGAPNLEKIIKVKIGTKTVDVRVFGQYASVVRVRNL